MPDTSSVAENTQSRQWTSNLSDADAWPSILHKISISESSNLIISRFIAGICDTNRPAMNLLCILMTNDGELQKGFKK